MKTLLDDKHAFGEACEDASENLPMMPAVLDCTIHVFMSSHDQKNVSLKIRSEVIDGPSIKHSMLCIGQSEYEDEESELIFFANTLCDKNELIGILLPVLVLDSELDLDRTFYEHDKNMQHLKLI